MPVGIEGQTISALVREEIHDGADRYAHLRVRTIFAFKRVVGSRRLLHLEAAAVRSYETRRTCARRRVFR
jgi:hypothetical protein